MKKFFCFSLLLLFISFVANSQSYKIFMKAVAPPGELGGMIIGNATDDKHNNEIEILSYSQGVASCSPSATRGGLGACKASISDLSIMMTLSPGVNQLRALTLTGKKLLSADLVYERTTGDQPAVFYKIHMEDITVTSVQESGSEGGDGSPTVSASFAASRIAWAIYKQNRSGALELANTVGFNVATNTLWNYSFQ